jgi:hypothetical protein
MKLTKLAVLLGLLAPFATHAAREGVPVYYNSPSVQVTNNVGMYQSSNGSLTGNYIGHSGQKYIVGQKTYSYQVPRPTPQTAASDSYLGVNGAMTANGIAMPSDTVSPWVISAGYTRRFADFQFTTGVNSILEWDDMIFNEIGVNARYNFSMRNFDMMAFGEYSRGTLGHGGLSMDYDLDPYDYKYPEYGVFTISMGELSGNTDNLRFGIGARNIWDVSGWKLSPVIGYEIFHHNLQMSNHKYPNPGIYLPLMDNNGNYVFGDTDGNFFTVPVGTTPDPNLYQICMSPEDIKIVSGCSDTNGDGRCDNLITSDYTNILGTIPWGVGPGECVIIGGDGTIVVPGTTHIYNTTWSGMFVGLEIEKQMTLADKLRFYVQVGMPHYMSEGTWPNRTDWQQNPSFIDEGDTDALSYRLEMEYSYKLSDRLSLALKVDTHAFHIGKIGGELYVASYSQYLIGSDGQYVLDQNGFPTIETVEAHTEKIKDSLTQADWQSFGLGISIKYSF